MNAAWMRKIELRLLNMIARSIVTKTIDDGPQLSSMTVSEGDDYREVERIQNYGFTALPGPNGDGLVVFPTGSREYPLLISVDHPEFRKKMAEWEAAIYTKFGTHVHLKADGSIDVNATQSLDMKSVKANLNFGPETNITTDKAVFTSPKFGVKGSQGELIAILSDVVQLLATLTSDPVSDKAPASFAATNQAAATLKAKLDSFKV